MALQLVQGTVQPLGQFDGYDSIALTVRGGEVGTIIGVPVGSDVAVPDADGRDGYVGAPPNHTRPCITTNLDTSGLRPLGLIDDGNENGYGTMFGSVLGGTGGQQVTGGAVLGPHTATGSGKLTLWDKAGTYAVTLDAVDTDASTGLVPTNTGLSVGDPLYATSAGLLTPTVGSAFESVVLGRLLNFETLNGGTLVNTPLFLVSALNSPVGQGPQQLQMTRALIYFDPPIA